MHFQDLEAPADRSGRADRQAIYRLFEEGRLDEDAATARLLALEIERRHLRVDQLPRHDD